MRKGSKVDSNQVVIYLSMKITWFTIITFDFISSQVKFTAIKTRIDHSYKLCQHFFNLSTKEKFNLTKMLRLLATYMFLLIPKIITTISWMRTLQKQIHFVKNQQKVVSIFSAAVVLSPPVPPWRPKNRALGKDLLHTMNLCSK